MKHAVVIANLGGPDNLQAVRPFLFNLFNDKAIIGLPQPFRSLLAAFIARRRASVAAQIYARMGGASPILPETTAQGAALETLLKSRLRSGDQCRVFTAMRYWHPFIEETAQAVKTWNADRIVLLPLYPQFSTTTTASFFKAWDEAAAKLGLAMPTARLCCYPFDPSFIAAHVHLIREAIAKIPAEVPYRLLFSAHGLPQRVIEKGDPYQWQIEQTARRIVQVLGNAVPDWRVCYQSRVGPLPWLEPTTEHEIRQAGKERKALVVVPIAFVSEHSETLVELDLDYSVLAAETGAEPYIRVPALGQNPSYIEGLANLVQSAQTQTGIIAATGKRICPNACRACPHPEAPLEALG